MSEEKKTYWRVTLKSGVMFEGAPITKEPNILTLQHKDGTSTSINTAEVVAVTVLEPKQRERSR